MPIVATCTCGEKFVLAGTVFPRSVACHTCGSRTVVSGPSESCTDDGWWVAEEAPPAHVRQANSQSSVLKCFVCNGRSVAACARCGTFYCPRHGKAFHGYSTCSYCFDRRRPAFLLVGILFILTGIFVAGMALFVPGPNEPKYPYYASFLPMAVLFLIAGMVYIWHSFRQYP